MESKEYNFEAALALEVDTLLRDFPEAKAMLRAYCDNCHDVDDIIDEAMTGSEFILRFTDRMLDVYTCNFWRQNEVALSMVDKLVNNDYADSVIWEHSDIPWQRTAADTLRHAGNMMSFAVILICCGREALRGISLKFRENSYKKHHNALTGQAI